MHKQQTDLFSFNNFLLLLIWTQENKDVTHPKRANQTPSRRKTSLSHFILDNQAVLLKCDHGLWLDLVARSQIYSDSQITKEVENLHSN